MTSTTLLFTTSLLFLTASSSIVPVSLPSVFQGQQTGIGSWYQADSARDSTNGHSWCGFTYTDSDPLFAPSLKLMGGATYSSDQNAWKEQTAKFCGLEAKVTDPDTGKTTLMYIGDSFAQPRSDGSIDIMLGAYTNLAGNPNGNKDTVVKNVQWELTGNQNTQYMAPGAKPVASSGKANASTGSGNSSSGNDTSSDGGNGQGSSSGNAATPTTLLTQTKTKGAGHAKTSAPAEKGQDGESSCSEE